MRQLVYANSRPGADQVNCQNIFTLLKGVDGFHFIAYNKEKEEDKTMTKAIYFDMDGTIANFYGVDGWLNDLINENT